MVGGPKLPKVRGLGRVGAKSLFPNENRQLALAALLILLLLAGLVTGLWWAGRNATEAVSSAVDELTDDDSGPVEIPAPTGKRIDESLDIVLVMDDSGSTDSSDPNGQRYDAAEQVVEFLATLDKKNTDDRVGVVHFGDDAPANLVTPLTSVQTNKPQLLAAIRQRGAGLGGTNFVAAFDRSGEVLGAPEAKRRQVVMVFTDGQGDNYDAIGQSIDALPTDRVHLVALNVDGSFDSVSNEWKQLGLSSTTRLDDVDDGKLTLAFARIIVDELGMKWGTTTSTTAPPTTTTTAPKKTTTTR